MTLPQEIIRAKRDGGALPAADIAGFVAGVAEGRISEGQIAAFAMAVFLRGMDRAETVALTLAMRDSGEVLDWSSLPGPVLDKHSTGGVGDNVSLMLAPILAACGAYVPMISGRGLGHTGGTLDKLEAIPGYAVTPDAAVVRRAVREAGCAIVGPSARLAPADGRIYAVRDTTATVESIPLITASILSKKLAAGVGTLVLDVKTGSGAFMADADDSRALARTLVEVAKGAGLRCRALLTGMDEPLAADAGNALELRNALRFLTGEGRDARLEAVTLALAVEALVVGGLAPGAAEAEAAAREALRSGRAAERFARMAALLGGPADLLERPECHLAVAPVVRAVGAGRAGTVAAVDTRPLGLAVVELGGGRRRPGDPIDPAVGLARIAPVGTALAAGDPLCLVHARDEAAAERAVRRVAAAITLADAAEPTPTVLERFG
ncbi:thymidine phosphorylase [Aureimonas flava]|uniref:Thymidine phosphorylase n=1 Tax=Aureimonas flava TaxID=2320271 RepID=A0A3A1WLE6_9HYPH|nr:thymidine phosphorylase [Aureimonas flava]RIY00291.1 thymidine phosphorylase [Aureimonas flava]